MEQERPSDVRRSVRTTNWTMLALIAALIILVLLVVYFATARTAEQDKLTQNELAQSTAVQQQPVAKPPAIERACASNQTYDLIKRELFRRAAQLRGSDQTAFDQLSSYAVVRVENPVMESRDASTGAINCSGSLSLDLPPGVAVVGQRRTLSSDVDYTIEQAADGSGPVVLLRNAEAIIAPLATLARANQPAATTAPAAPASPSPAPVEANGAAPEPATKAPAPEPRQPPRPAPGPVVPPRARPSFDCSRARTRGEIAVCSNAGLAALDRNMATQYVSAMAAATPEQRALLRSTRSRFILYRDRCPNRSCIGDAYVGRMREIRDIMQGTWRPHP